LAINTYRLTITVPLSVKEQMDQLKEPVNWSAVAAEAFQRKVIEVRSGRAKAMTKAKVIERLRAAGKADPKGFEAGRAFGRKWAEEKALPRHLRVLAKNPNEAWEGYENPETDPELSMRIAWTILEGDVGKPLSMDTAGQLGLYFPDVASFWREAVGLEDVRVADGEDFARGFIAGALEVWEEIKEDLPG
jgi:hypothetical protein